MFCPNCGKDCQDARFCTPCGTNLQNDESLQAHQTAWSVGMPCPHCGGTKLEGQNCAFCGAQLLDPLQQPQQTDTQEDSYEFPVGSYMSSIGDFLNLGNVSLSITKGILFKKIKTSIPYDQMNKVMLVRPRKDDASFGYLLFRYQDNKEVPIPDTGKFGPDKTTLIVRANKIDLFYHIFCVLRTVVPASAEFSIVTPPMTEGRLEKLAAEVNMGASFERFAPYRDRAVEYVCKAVDAEEKEARILVDTAFDARQAEMYAANPALAVRDLNRILADIKRQEEEEEQERETRARRRAYRRF